MINKVILQPAFVLHTRNYRDSSLLVDLFTQDYGRLRVIAKGARGLKSKFRGVCSPFLNLTVTFSGKSELKLLQHAETTDPSFQLKSTAILSGFYLNELLIKLIPAYEAYPNIYLSYQKTIAQLTNIDKWELEIGLRLFEKTLLAELGYGLQLDYTAINSPVMSNKQYFFEFGHGLIEADRQEMKTFPGKSLLALNQGEFTNQDELRDAKRLLSSIIATLLGKQRLRSRELFISSRY